MKIISRILITALALVLAAHVIPGIHVEGVYAAIIASLIIGILNITVRPILVVLTLPITLLTLGLFIFIINALLFWFAASFIEGFEVNGFLAAIIGSVFVSVVSAIANRFVS